MENLFLINLNNKPNLITFVFIAGITWNVCCWLLICLFDWIELTFFCKVPWRWHILWIDDIWINWMKTELKFLKCILVKSCTKKKNTSSALLCITVMSHSDLSQRNLNEMFFNDLCSDSVDVLTMSEPVLYKTHSKEKRSEVQWFWLWHSIPKISGRKQVYIFDLTLTELDKFSFNSVLDLIQSLEAVACFKDIF